MAEVFASEQLDDLIINIPLDVDPRNPLSTFLSEQRAHAHGTITWRAHRRAIKAAREAIRAKDALKDKKGTKR
ncbi:MAG TPA: hypothetical protein VMC43_03755 [Candidatus Paceibacterota bacterium]|nr:hypothetical protein [Candidatus Paceibacterota bacterium]